MLPAQGRSMRLLVFEGNSSVFYHEAAPCRRRKLSAVSHSDTNISRWRVYKRLGVCSSEGTENNLAIVRRKERF